MLAKGQPDSRAADHAAPTGLPLGIRAPATRRDVMRLLLFAFPIAILSIASAGGALSVTRAQAQECTGENCPQPSGQGRDCEHKKENNVS